MDDGMKSAGLLTVTLRVGACRVVSRAALGTSAIVTARQLGPEGRGVLVLILASASFSLLFCSMGVNTSARIQLADRDATIDSGDYLGLSVLLVLLQVIICLALGVTLLPLAGVDLSFADEVLFAVVGGTMIAKFMLNDGLNAYGLLARAAAVDAAGSAAQLGVVVLLAALGVTPVAAYLAVIAGASVIQSVLALAVLRHSEVSIRPRWRLAEWVTLVRTGLPAIPMGVGEVLAFRIDHYIIAAFLTPAAAGIYSFAATVPELLRLLPVALGPSIFYRLAARKASLDELRRPWALCLLVSAALAALGLVLAPSAVRLVVGSRYEAAITPLRILLVAELGITAFYLNGSFLAGLDRVGSTAVAAVAGVAVEVLGSLVLVPALGITGAAVASLIAYWAMGLISFGYVRRLARSSRA